MHHLRSLQHLGYAGGICVCPCCVCVGIFVRKYMQIYVCVWICVCMYVCIYALPWHIVSTGTVPLKCILCMQKCIKHSPMTGSLNFTITLAVFFAVLLAVVMRKFPRGGTLKFLSFFLKLYKPALCYRVYNFQKNETKLKICES